MGNVSKNYDVEELVHPAIVQRYGRDRAAFALKKYAPHLVEGQQRLREFVGSACVVNDYHWSKEYKDGGWDAIKRNEILRKRLFINSGWRDFANPFRRNLSAHYALCATDTKQGKYTPQDLQQMILDSPYEFPNVIRMEDAGKTRGWLHIQYGHRSPGQLIEVFKP